MNSFKTTLIAAALCAAAGCKVPDTSIVIAQTVAGYECGKTPNPDNQISAGSVDFNFFDTTGRSGARPRYLLGLRLHSNLANQDVTGNQGTNINPANRNDFLLSGVIFRYFGPSGVSIPDIPEELTPVSGLLTPGGDLYPTLDILTASAVRFDRLPRAAQEAAQKSKELVVNVGIRARGNFRSGAEYETEEFVFPLTVRYSDPSYYDTCPLEQRTNVGIPLCGNYGQDGTGWVCTDASTKTGG